MLVSIYGSALLTQFVAITMAIVGKALYWKALFQQVITISSEDLSAANRIFVCLSAHFVQNGIGLLVESVRNSVKAVFEKVPLQEPTSQTLLSSLISQVRHELETTCGRNILIDCLFGRLDEMISADLSSTRRRLFIALATEARRIIKNVSTKEILTRQIDLEVNELVESAVTNSAVPFISIIPKVNAKFTNPTITPKNLLSQFEIELKKAAAAVFVCKDHSDITDIFMSSIK